MNRRRNSAREGQWWDDLQPAILWTLAMSRREYDFVLIGFTAPFPSKGNRLETMEEEGKQTEDTGGGSGAKKLDEDAGGILFGPCVHYPLLCFLASFVSFVCSSRPWS